MFSSSKFFCLSLLIVAPVLSLPLTKRDVVDPPVLAPNASTVWNVGTTQTVVWNTSGLPPYNQITNRIGRVILGHLGGGGLNLMLNKPLAQGFNITQGSVDIIVPNVPPRTDYLIVLMGDSGNASPTFTITGGSSSNTPSSTSSSTTQTSSSSTSTSTSTTQASSSTSAPSTISSTSASASTTSSTSAPVSTTSSTSAPVSTTSSTSAPVSTTSSTSAPVSTTTSTFASTSTSTSTSASSPTSPSAPLTTTVSSTSTPSVSNTITSTLSSTIVVVQTTQPTTTGNKSNGALSTHRIGASCLSVALIISGLLI